MTTVAMFDSNKGLNFFFGFFARIGSSLKVDIDE
jgi:hypothetical protein